MTQLKATKKLLEYKEAKIDIFLFKKTSNGFDLKEAAADCSAAAANSDEVNWFERSSASVSIQLNSLA